MYAQREFFRTAQTVTLNNTTRFELPNNGYLMGMFLQIYGTPVNDARIATHHWRMVDGITKIEVMSDATNPIFSLPGPLAKYAAWKDGAPAILDQQHNYGTSTLRWWVPINFGRYYKDAKFGLDLSKHPAPELRISTDWTSTYFTTALYADIMLLYMRDVTANPFSGYLRKEVWQSYTTVASEKKYYQLPTERLVRSLVLQVHPDISATMNAERAPYSTLNNIQLNYRTGEKKVFDASLRYLWYDNAFEVGRDVVQGAESYHSDGYGVWTGLGQSLYKAGARLPHGGTQNTYGTCVVPGEDSATQQREVPSDTEQDSLMFYGLSMENCAWFDFKTPDEPAGYLNPEAEKTVQLNLTIGSDTHDTGAVINIATDRFVSY